MDRLLEYINRHPFLASLVVAMVLAVIAFEMRNRRLGFAALGSQDAIRLMNQGAHVYDVREPEAFAGGHINGARSLARAQHEQAAEVLKKYREKPVVLYCEDGSVSSGLARRLQAAGFTRVFNLRGGLATWRADGLPLQR
jgi:rhodanese-related sulfurtransferase